MRPKRTIYGALCTALVVGASALLPSAASAQWSIEGRLGATLPTGDLTDDPGLNQTAGLAFGADLMYSLRPSLTLYGGGGVHQFNCDDCALDVSSSGFDAGVKFLFGSDADALFWARGGLLLHKPDFDVSEGDWELGIDSGVGIDWRVSEVFTVVPALRFNTYSADDRDITYLVIDLGGHFHFGR